MFCMACGSQIPKSAKFCSNCGTSTSATSASQLSIESSLTASEAKPILYVRSSIVLTEKKSTSSESPTEGSVPLPMSDRRPLPPVPGSEKPTSSSENFRKLQGAVSLVAGLWGAVHSLAVGNSWLAFMFGAVVVSGIYILATKKEEEQARPSPPPPSEEVKELARTPGNASRVAAVKAYREQTGLGLKESKDVVDRLYSSAEHDAGKK